MYERKMQGQYQIFILTKKLYNVLTVLKKTLLNSNSLLLIIIGTCVKIKI